MLVCLVIRYGNEQLTTLNFAFATRKLRAKFCVWLEISLN